MKKKEQQPRYLSSLIGEKTPSKMAGLSYSALVCAYCAVTLVAQLLTSGIGEARPQWYLYLAWLIAPVFFAVTIVWYFSFTQTSVKSFIKAQKTSPKYYLLALLLQAGILCLGEVNALFLRFLQKFGYQLPEMSLPSTEGFGLVGVLFAVAVLPAILEEVFFRGILLAEMKDFSPWARILLCGGVFALYHQSPAQTLYQFACGVGIAWITVRAGSIFPVVCSHFTNNALVVVCAACGVTQFEWYVVLLSGICLVGTLVYLLVFDKNKEEKKATKKGAYREFFTFASVGVVVFGLTWLLGLVG